VSSRARGFRPLPCHSVNTWSRRRESNPRQTALQAATFATRSLRHVRAQDDSNVRLLLRRKPCSPLHHEPRSASSRTRTCVAAFGGRRPIHWTMEACVPDCAAFTPARHCERSRCRTCGVPKDPVLRTGAASHHPPSALGVTSGTRTRGLRDHSPALALLSFSHHGRSGRIRTCGIRCVGPAL
jgi:hypothetical protein